MAAVDDEWIEVRRTVDALEAEVTVNFLRDHGVSVQTRGSSGTNPMPHIMATRETRIVVPRSELEHAHEALMAMTAADAIVEPAPELEPESKTEGPYRSGMTVARKKSGVDDVPERSPRSRVAAVFLAFLVPIGGGHFYARHNAAGAFLAAGIVGLFVGGMLVGSTAPMVAAVVLVVFDAVLAPLACKRCNEGRIPEPASQRRAALLGLFVAVIVMMVLATTR